MNSTELLKLAVSDLEDFAANDPSYACHFCKYNYGDEYCPESRPCFVWVHADRVRELTADSTSADNEELFKLLAQIRNYSATPGWDLFEEDVDRLIGRQRMRNGDRQYWLCQVRFVIDTDLVTNEDFIKKDINGEISCMTNTPQGEIRIKLKKLTKAPDTDVAMNVLPKARKRNTMNLCIGHCPVCNTPFFRGDYYEICPECLQKLDWSDVNGVE